jgi:hypothetical protein
MALLGIIGTSSGLFEAAICRELRPELSLVSNNFLDCRYNFLASQVCDCQQPPLSCRAAMDCRRVSVGVNFMNFRSLLRNAEVAGATEKDRARPVVREFAAEGAGEGDGLEGAPPRQGQHRGCKYATDTQMGVSRESISAVTKRTERSSRLDEPVNFHVQVREGGIGSVSPTGKCDVTPTATRQPFCGQSRYSHIPVNRLATSSYFHRNNFESFCPIGEPRPVHGSGPRSARNAPLSPTVISLKHNGLSHNF